MQNSSLVKKDVGRKMECRPSNEFACITDESHDYTEEAEDES